RGLERPPVLATYPVTPLNRDSDATCDPGEVGCRSNRARNLPRTIPQLGRKLRYRWRPHGSRSSCDAPARPCDRGIALRPFSHPPPRLQLSGRALLYVLVAIRSKEHSLLTFAAGIDTIV